MSMIINNQIKLENFINNTQPIDSDSGTTLKKIINVINDNKNSLECDSDTLHVTDPLKSRAHLDTSLDQIDCAISTLKIEKENFKSVQFEEGGRYEGQWEDDKPEGQGKMTFSDGSSYEGNWSAGKKHGLGVHYYPNGEKFIGTYENGIKQGKGLYLWQTGALAFEGNFINDMVHGYAIFYDGAGHKSYEGEWLEDQLIGKLTCYYTNGNLAYVGECKESQRHGDGIYYHENGKKLYEGQWAHGECHGRGTFYYENGLVEYIGEWKEGQRHGDGIYYYENGNKLYEGQWLKGECHGRGTSYYENGKLEYIGEWKEGQRQGKGIYYHINGKEQYVGCWEKGQYHGNGIIYYDNGQKYFKGELKEGKYHGLGQSFFKNGKLKYKGNYLENLYHGKGELFFENGQPNYAGEFKKNDCSGMGLLYYPNPNLNGFAFGKFDGENFIGDYVHFIKNTPKFVKTIENEQSIVKGSLNDKEEKDLKEQYLNFMKTLKAETDQTNSFDATKFRDEIIQYIHNTPSTHEESADKPNYVHSTAKKKNKNKKPPSKVSKNLNEKQSLKISEEEMTLPEDNKVPIQTLSPTQKKLLKFLREGPSYLPSLAPRVRRWQSSNLLLKMETFQDGSHFPYQGMSNEEKLKMIRWHEAGSMLDPLLFHPDMKGRYIFENGDKIGYYVEIRKNKELYGKGIIGFGIHEKIYHRMFENRADTTFFTLTMDEFFTAKSKPTYFTDETGDDLDKKGPSNSDDPEKSLKEKFPSHSNDFRHEDTPNQLFYSDVLFELDPNTGVLSVEDTREHIGLRVCVFPLDSIKGSFANNPTRPFTNPCKNVYFHNYKLVTN